MWVRRPLFSESVIFWKTKCFRIYIGALSHIFMWRNFFLFFPGRTLIIGRGAANFRKINWFFKIGWRHFFRAWKVKGLDKSAEPREIIHVEENPEFNPDYSFESSAICVFICIYKSACLLEPVISKTSEPFHGNLFWNMSHSTSRNV